MKIMKSSKTLKSMNRTQTYRLYFALATAFVILVIPATAFAEGDPLTVINNLSDFGG